ncbi:DUF2752 domain-containing protein [Lishizhenia sp.]|uniref:DUF2752 domain-containing protein n=1 Tax=Lishizhenia sp. TaxID=2497594 RepID=UPI0039AEEEEA
MCIPLLLLFLPATYFDEGQSICPSKLLFNKECPGCGITRSVQHAIHLDFQASWDYNKLIIIVLPLLLLFWLYYARKFYQSAFK